MERSPTPSGRRTHAKTAHGKPPPTTAPSHWTATPRATSTATPASSPPGTYAAAVVLPAVAPATAQSSPSTGFYKPLQDPENSDDDDNPFREDSEEDDGPLSPPLLSAPFNDTTIDIALGVEGTTDLFEAAVGDNGGAGQDPNNASQIQTPPTVAALENTAAIMADFALFFNRQKEEFAQLLEKLSFTLNRCMDELHSTTNSNHGHIMKRLFPELEKKIASLESSLATTTHNLETKGATLLANVNDLNVKISTTIEERLTSLESMMALPQTSTSRTSRPREPPDNNPPTPACMAASPKQMTFRGEDNDMADRFTPDRHSPMEDLTNEAPINVNARTRVAYDRARELNPTLLVDTAGNHSGGTPIRTPARNPYNTSTMHRQPLRQTTLHETLGNTARPPVEHRGNSNIRSEGGSRQSRISSSGTHIGRGGPIVSPPHSNQARHARTLGASRFDVIRLASADYHVGMEGLATLTENDIRAGGYGEVKATAEDVVVCYNNIILAHRKVTEL
jgi:hypothetical protein